MDGQTDRQTTKRKVAHDLQSHRHMHQFNNLFFKYKVCKTKLRSGLTVFTVTVQCTPGYYLPSPAPIPPTLGLFLQMPRAFLFSHLVARYVSSLAQLPQLAQSTALHYATLTSLNDVCSFHRLTRFLHSLPDGTVKFYKYVSTLLM